VGAIAAWLTGRGFGRWLLAAGTLLAVSGVTRLLEFWITNGTGIANSPQRHRDTEQVKKYEKSERKTPQTSFPSQVEQLNIRDLLDSVAVQLNGSLVAGYELSREGSPPRRSVPRTSSLLSGMPKTMSARMDRSSLGWSTSVPPRRRDTTG
jgi:hypothetical protein